MLWFGVFSITHLFGTVLFMGAAISLIIRWFKLTKAVSPAKQFSEFFIYVNEFFGKNLRLFIIAIIGGGIAMTSVGVGDSIASKPCVEACKVDGWKRGRLRSGNPHKQGEFSKEKECWCYSGKKWSLEPLSLDSQK